MKKSDFLAKEVRHIDIKSFDATKIVQDMNHMGFTAREVGLASELLDKMLMDQECTVILALAGSTSSAGCMQLYVDMAEHNMVDAVVATGASIIDMDFFEALGFKHYQGDPYADDEMLCSLGIDRIYDTYIDESESQICCDWIARIADGLAPSAYSSRQFIQEIGRFLFETPDIAKKRSLIQVCYEKDIPIFCPAFSDSSAGYGLVRHQVGKEKHAAIDSVKDFKELAHLKMNVAETGVLIIGGGTPKNFVQDVVLCTEYSGKRMPMHKYAVQITVADPRDGACSSSTLREARSWGKVDSTNTQMVFAEATAVLPLMVSYLYHKGGWKLREEQRLSCLYETPNLA